MLFDNFINFLLSPIDLLISILPSFSDFNVPQSALNSIGDLLGGLGYIVPWRGILPIFYLSASWVGFRMLWAILLRIKSFIPTMGA